MSDLSHYIKKELNTILQQINNTPKKKPKKSESLQKIKHLVEGAPLMDVEKKTINRSIRKIESAMALPRKNTPMSNSVVNNKYAKNLFYENMFLE